MLSEVFGLTANSVGLGALLTLVVLLILTGRLVPRRTHEDALADRDRWREAFLNSEAAREEEHKQTGELLEMARINGPLLAALPRPGQAEGEEVSGGGVARMDQAPRARS